MFSTDGVSLKKGKVNDVDEKNKSRQTDDSEDRCTLDNPHRIM